MQNQNSKKIFEAIAYEEVITLLELLEKVDDINKISDDEITPLLLAVKTGNIEITQLLIAKGAPVNSVDSRGQNLIMKIAADNESVEMMRFLISAGVEINQVDLAGHNALMDAALFSNYQNIALLIESGATINLADFFKIFATSSANFAVASIVQAFPKEACSNAWNLLLRQFVDYEIQNLLNRETVGLLAINLPEGSLKNSIIQNFNQRNSTPFKNQIAAAQNQQASNDNNSKTQEPKNHPQFLRAKG